MGLTLHCIYMYVCVSPSQQSPALPSVLIKLSLSLVTSTNQCQMKAMCQGTSVSTIPTTTTTNATTKDRERDEGNVKNRACCIWRLRCTDYLNPYVHLRTLWSCRQLEPSQQPPVCNFFVRTSSMLVLIFHQGSRFEIFDRTFKLQRHCRPNYPGGFRIWSISYSDVIVFNLLFKKKKCSSTGSPWAEGYNSIG